MIQCRPRTAAVQCLRRCTFVWLLIICLASCSPPLRAAMGCVQAKPSSESPPRSLEKLKSEHGYVPSSGRPPRPRAAATETVPEQKRPPPPPSPPLPRQLVAGDDELVDGWPRWLVNNIPKDVLACLVPKSADSYVKIDKVSSFSFLTLL